MGEEIAGVIAREAQRIIAAQVDAAQQLATVRERNHRNALHIAGAWADELVIAGRVLSQPGLLQRNVLRREARHRLDHDEVGKIFGRRAVGDEEVAHVVIRIAQDETDVLDVETGPQSIRQRNDQGVQGFGLQQPQLATLRPPQDLFVSGHLGRQLVESPPCSLQLRFEFVPRGHILSPLSRDNHAPFP